MTPEETAYAFKCAFISTDVWQALQAIQRGEGNLPELQRRALREGAQLLHEMCRGTALLLGGSTSLGFSEESLTVAGHALSTLHALQLVSTRSEVGKILQEMSRRLHDLERNVDGGGPIVISDPDSIVALERFFAFLSESFSDDVVQSSFGQESPDEADLFF